MAQSSLSTSTLRNQIQPLQGLQDKQQLEKLLNDFFTDNNISNLMTETGTALSSPAYSLKAGSLRVDVLSGNEGFRIVYRPKEKHRTKCPNHFVDKALEILLRKTGYEVKLEEPKQNDTSPHERSMIVTINPYILDAYKTREQNLVLTERFKTTINDNQKRYENLQKANESLRTNLGRLTEVENTNNLMRSMKNMTEKELAAQRAENERLEKNIAQNEAQKKQNQILKNQLKRELTDLKTSLQKNTTEIKSTTKQNQNLAAQNKQLKSKLLSKQIEKKSLVAQNTQLESALASKRNEYLQDIERLQEANKSLQRRLAELQKVEKQNQTLNKALIKKEDDCFNKITKNENNLQEKNKQLMIKLEEKQSQNKKLKADIRMLSVSSLPLQTENTKLRDENKDLKNQNQKLKEEFLETVSVLNQEVMLAIESSKTQDAVPAY